MLRKCLCKSKGLCLAVATKTAAPECRAATSRQSNWVLGHRHCSRDTLRSVGSVQAGELAPRQATTDMSSQVCPHTASQTASASWCRCSFALMGNSVSPS